MHRKSPRLPRCTSSCQQRRRRALQRLTAPGCSRRSRPTHCHCGALDSCCGNEADAASCSLLLPAATADTGSGTTLPARMARWAPSFLAALGALPRRRRLPPRPACQAAREHLSAGSLPGCQACKADVWQGSAARRSEDGLVRACTAHLHRRAIAAWHAVPRAGRHELLLRLQLCGMAAQPGEVRHVCVGALPNQACVGVGGGSRRALGVQGGRAVAGHWPTCREAGLG